MWFSHGFYYESKLDRWEWQRARCFQNVEDIGNHPYVVQYLAPMLEKAGANVFIPRDRGIQPNMVIVDNDASMSRSKFSTKGKWTKINGGYKHKEFLFPYENPFTMGASLKAETSAGGGAEANYQPDIPEAGEYAVYVSWSNTGNNVSDVQYKVTHTGGVSTFTVNQKMYGATWQYLGTFQFDKGRNPDRGMVAVSNRSNETGVVTTDAVRFGTGIGSVMRRPSETITLNVPSSSNAVPQVRRINPEDYTWKSSGIPRYLEGSRYYLQFAGMPDTVYSPTHYQNDYNDDYRSRGLWVNYLLGQFDESAGKSIPLDLSLAFHTDAGTTPNDSIVGTLAIYSTRGEKFQNGVSKEESGIFSGMVQDQIVSDIRFLQNSNWSQRDLRNASYSEATSPDVPALLLELLSHQNMADLVYGLDPRFRFTVARAIYKGMLRYLSKTYGTEYVVQPLPAKNIAIERIGGKRVKLSWTPVNDPLEPTAVPNRYRIYSRVGDRGYSPDFIEVKGTSHEFELPSWGERYSYQVVAVNDGGEGFPTEEISACLFNKDEKPVLIVNGFDRISGPLFFDMGDMAGIQWWQDEGVADNIDVAFLGYQYCFNRNAGWLDDDSPGWGASGIEGWGKQIAGNTHDYPRRHGKTYQKMGISYVSQSRDAFEENPQDPYQYGFLDVLFGEQRTVKNFREEREKGSFPVYTPQMIASIRTFNNNRTPVLISGAYVGSDMIANSDSTAIKFARDELHYLWMANHATRDNAVYATDHARPYMKGTYHFNNVFGPNIYRVESPDAIEPAEGSVRLFRYKDNNLSAGSLFDGDNKIVVIGFPLETVWNENEKYDLMRQIVAFFNKR